MFWLELSASLLVLVQIYFYGRKTLWGPILGVSAAIAFIIYMILANAWGFLPMNLIGLALHAYNWYMWNKY